MSVELSNRGFFGLQMFAEQGPHYYMTLEEAQKIDQRPFRGMLVRGYIAWRPRHGFHITRKGLDAWSEWNATTIARSEAMFTKPVTSYFDMDAYGLRPKVHVMAKRGAA